MNEFRDYMKSLSFEPESILFDGKIHRFKRGKGKDSAWYIAWENPRIDHKGTYQFGRFGDWSDGSEFDFKSANMSRHDLAAVKSQMEAAKRQAAEDRRARHKEAADKAQKYWPLAKAEGTTPYLNRKKIDALYGARVYVDTLQIPVYNARKELVGLQYIQADGVKRFLSGTDIQGSFFVIGKLEVEAYLCEGYATGCSIHMATGKPVVIAFNSGNLPHVAKALREHFKDVSITVCGDEDLFTVIRGEPRNVGREAAEKAALITESEIYFPVFPESALESKPTDFNDLHVLFGISAVKKALAKEVAPEVGFIPLGYDESTYFFYERRSKDIVKISGFSESQMFELAEKKYWEANYPKGENGGINWAEAKNTIIELSRKIGQFDSSRIRGSGAWRDGKDIVINTGHYLEVNGKRHSLTGYKSWNIYIQTRNRLPEIHKRPLTVGELAPFLDLCAAFKWRDEKSAHLLAGWLAIARIAGALDIHPHVWLTGPSGSGKSTLMERLIAPMLGGPKGKLYVNGGSTEAGIRQTVKSDSIPLVFDEFEANNESSKARLESMIELLRNAWSTTQGSIVKGSAGGHSVQFQLSFPALVSSIRINLTNDADRSRFSILELTPHGNESIDWETKDKLLKEIDDEFGERLFARMRNKIREIIASQKTLMKAFSGAVSQRYGQQAGTLLAGWWMLQSDKAITPEEAALVVADLELDDEKETAKETDEKDCLEHLLTSKCRYTVTDDNKISGNPVEIRYEKSFDEMLKNYQTDMDSALRTHGIRVKGDYFQVANTHAELSKIYKGTRWADNWSSALVRITGASKAAGLSLDADHRSVRCVKIPLSSL